MDEKCTLSDNKPNLRQQLWSVAVQQSSSPVVRQSSGRHPFALIIYYWDLCIPYIRFVFFFAFSFLLPFSSLLLFAGFWSKFESGQDLWSTVMFQKRIVTPYSIQIHTHTHKYTQNRYFLIPLFKLFIALSLWLKDNSIIKFSCPETYWT